MTEQERSLGTRWFDQVWNQQRREAIAEMLAPTAVLHDGSSESTGPEGFHPFFERIHGSFSDIRTTVHDTVAEGDKVCFRWSFDGTHSGDKLGFPATGRRVHVTGVAIIRCENGMITEGWQNWDMLGMLEQLKGGQRAATYVGA
jgi:steroid delta-isomerase-like uncharacterized protein